MTQIQNRLLLRLPVLAFTMLPALAAAQNTNLPGDAKTFPGAMCQPSDPTTAFTRNDMFGRMFNVDPHFAPGPADQRLSNPQFWVCPILRDNTDAHSASLTAAIEVIDQNEDELLTCDLCSFSAQGEEVECVRRSADASPPQPKELLWNNNPSIVSTFQGYYFFRCSIPPRSRAESGGQVSGVVTYRWAER